MRRSELAKYAIHRIYIQEYAIHLIKIFHRSHKRREEGGYVNGPSRVWKNVICVQNVGAGTGCARIVSSHGTGHTAFDVIGIYSEASDQSLLFGT